MGETKLAKTRANVQQSSFHIIDLNKIGSIMPVFVDALMLPSVLMQPKTVFVHTRAFTMYVSFGNRPLMVQKLIGFSLLTAQLKV